MRKPADPAAKGTLLDPRMHDDSRPLDPVEEKHHQAIIGAGGDVANSLHQTEPGWRARMGNTTYRDESDPTD